jgi:glycosyltransferase involved in cell wall biosynthesis
MTVLAADPVSSPPMVAVVIPCYRVGDAVFRVIAAIGPDVHRIYVVDDCCPEKTGDRVEQADPDPRVVVLRHAQNKGVGGAVITGYQQAANDGATVVVKLDGDGQMDPALLPRFIRPILQGRADYTKGNRFYRLSSLRGMPPIRTFGNAVLSFMTKFSSGYWRVFDPTNGYTAIHGALLRHMPLDRIAQDYFFESDMLFRLNTLRAVVLDIPMDAVYADEVSGLKIGKVIPRFLARHAVNLGKRVFYNYFLRDFQIASLAMVAGVPLTLFGVIFGLCSWIEAANHGVAATAGTVMLAALPILIGVQLLLLAMGYDIQNQPSTPVHPDME